MSQGTVVCDLSTGNTVLIPFADKENAKTIAITLWKMVQALKPDKDGKVKPGTPTDISFSCGDVDPVAWVRVDLIVGFFVQYENPMVTQLRRQTDIMEKASDPDKGESWRGDDSD